MGDGKWVLLIWSLSTRRRKSRHTGSYDDLTKVVEGLEPTLTDDDQISMFPEDSPLAVGDDKEIG